MAYPDKVLGDDEEIVAHLHPHWLTIFWPVVRFLLIVGAASFAMAVIPAGRQQGILRMLVLALAVVLLLTVVAVPLLRWRTTHYVITTHRLLFREGILTRRGRDLGLSRITDVSYTQTLWERIINSGTLSIESAGEGGATVLRRIPDSERVQQLLNHMVEEDSDRRAQESAGYVRGDHDDDADDDRYGPDGYGPDGYGPDDYGPDGYGPDGYGPDGYGPDGYGPDGYGPDGYGRDDRGDGGHRTLTF